MASGWARRHAVPLLRQLGAIEAIEPLLTALQTSEPLSPTYDASEAALRALAPAGLDCLLAALDKADDPALRCSVADVLSSSPQRDPHSLAALLAYLREEPELGVGCWVEYGDPAPLPALSEQLAALPTDGDLQNLPDREIIALCDAIEAPGGTLPLPSSQPSVRPSKPGMSERGLPVTRLAQAARTRSATTTPAPVGAAKSTSAAAPLDGTGCLGRPACSSGRPDSARH